MHKFTDFHGHRFIVNDQNNSGTGCFELGARIDDGTIWRAFPVDEAPAIALAILEAAGIEGRAYTCDNDEEVALHWLRKWQVTRKEQAEREAEDAKVRKFFSTMWPIAYHNTGRVTDMMRTEYNAAREFFQES